VDPNEGLYWAYEKSGFVERVVSEARIERFIHQPPEDTRAWTRAMLLRAAGPEGVNRVDWDHMRFRLVDQSYWPRYRTLDLDHPLALTKADWDPIFRNAAGLDDILDRLEAPRIESSSRGTTSVASAGDGASATAPSAPLLSITPVKNPGEPDIRTISDDMSEQDGGQNDEIS
jgi:hypothetical protein